VDELGVHKCRAASEYWLAMFPYVQHQGHTLLAGHVEADVSTYRRPYMDSCVGASRRKDDFVTLRSSSGTRSWRSHDGLASQ
jgi:hypothetical protein